VSSEEIEGRLAKIAIRLARLKTITSAAPSASASHLPMATIRPALVRCALAAVVLGPLWPAGGTLPSGSERNLARQYLSVRSDIQRYLTLSALADVSALIDRPDGASAMKEAFLRQARSGADWNPENPKWQRMASMIDQDMPQISSELASGSDPSALSRQVDEAVVDSISSRLSAEQLRALVEHYSSPSGRRFASVQTQIVSELLAGSAAAMASNAGGGDPGRPGESGSRADKPVSNADVQEMVGLVDEYVQIQLGLLDPGDRGDRSGLQAIPSFFGIGARATLDSLEEKWHSIGPPDRAAIVTWRRTPLALAERQALWAAARRVHRVADPGAAAQRFSQVLEKYQRKWAAELDH